MKSLLRALLLAAVLATPSVAQQDTVFTWSKRLPDGARFAIRNLSGPIEVRPGTSDRVEVRATIRVESRGLPGDVTFDVREAAVDDVEICTVYRGGSACELDNGWNDIRVTVRYIVDVPKGLRLRAGTGNGDVIVMQEATQVDASTGNGDVVVRESLTGVSASTGNGNVTVAMANGPVRTTTGNGKVVVNAAKGPVNATTGNGDIDVRMISVPEGAGQPPMSLTTGHGVVRLRLPADFSGAIDAFTSHGSVRSDFEVRAQGRAEDSRLQGTIGSGNGPIIKLRSSNGRLEIRKD